MSTRTLSISLYNRPEYSNIVLEHLDKCIGVDNYQFLICCEPTDKDVISLASKFRKKQTTVVINKTRLGCNRNIYQCLNTGFKANDFHIHLEDDTVPGKDFLLYCEWSNYRYANDNTVFSVCGYNKSISDEYARVGKRNWFNPWGWATWSNRWKIVNETLFDELQKPEQHSWDIVVHKKFLGSKFEIYPFVARTQNIGAENGQFCPDPDWHKLHQYNEYWIETDKKYQTNFYEVYE